MSHAQNEVLSEVRGQVCFRLFYQALLPVDLAKEDYLPSNTPLTA